MTRAYLEGLLLPSNNRDPSHRASLGSATMLPAPVIPTLATLDLPGVSAEGPIAFFNASLVKATVTTASAWRRDEIHVGNLPDHLSAPSNHRQHPPAHPQNPPLPRLRVLPLPREVPPRGGPAPFPISLSTATLFTDREKFL